MKTQVEHTREATITLGDGCPLRVVAEYEANGELRCLLLNQDNTVAYPDGVEQTVMVAELEYVEKLIYAILAVLPTGMSAEIQGGV